MKQFIFAPCQFPECRGHRPNDPPVVGEPEPARKPDEKRVVEAVFAALRAAKGARQHLNLLPACTGGHDVAEYNVILKDADGSDTASDLIEGLPAVKKRARRLFSNEFAQFLGATHECV